MKIYHSKNLFYIIALSSAAFIGTTHSNPQPFFKEPFTQYQKENWKNSGRLNNGIDFLKDAEDNIFVKKDQYSKLTAIHDTLGAKIGYTTNIPVNQVQLLPEGSIFMGKEVENIATLHTHVPGISIDKIKNIGQIDIEEGLSSRTLKSISQHKDLCSIIALNLYLNNKDSHKGNVFFDEKTNSFCAIDQGDIFASAFAISDQGDRNSCLRHILSFNSLAKKSLQYLDDLENEYISNIELKALINVKTKLDQLIEKYPSEKIYTEWMQLADKADYLCSFQKKECLKIMFDHNVYENKQLCSKLDEIIKINAIPYSIRRMAQPSKNAQHDFWHATNS